MDYPLIPEHIQMYAEQYTTAEDDVLAELNRETHLSVHNPVMLSGHLQGKVLEMISKMIRPQSILELGTYTGYSAICLAKGLGENGKLHTIDVSQQLKDINKRYFQKAGLTEKIVQHFGPAIDVIPNLPGTFDLVFIDADKGNYSLYFEMVIERLRPGGFILADNVLFHGEVFLPEEKMGKAAKAISAFNKLIANDPRIEHVLLPIRDGMMIIAKK